jgi:hypothetical protein
VRCPRSERGVPEDDVPVAADISPPTHHRGLNSLALAGCVPSIGGSFASHQTHLQCTDSERLHMAFEGGDWRAC